MLRLLPRRQDLAVVGRLGADRVGVAGITGEQEGLAAAAAEVLLLLVAGAARFGHPVVATEAVEAEGLVPDMPQRVLAHIGELHR
ncbi:hypothetical protein D3C85_1693950 [compost metagenome]